LSGSETHQLGPWVRGAWGRAEALNYGYLGLGLGLWVMDAWGRAEALNYEDLGWDLVSIY